MYLLNFAIGDAYGSGFEFINKPFPFLNNLEEFYKNPNSKKDGSVFTPAGWFTDDTEMTLAIAETIIENDINDITPDIFIHKFLELFHTEKRPGYASGFYNFLLTVKDVNDFKSRIISTSDRNGAMMRSSPLGFIKDINPLLALTEMQASITHNTFSSIISAKIISLLYHYTIYNLGKKVDCISFIKENLYKNYEFRSDIHPDIQDEYFNKIEPLSGKISLNGFKASLNILDLFLSHNNEKDLLLDVIDRTGDTDTGASLALGLATLSSEYEHNLPNDFIDKFKNMEPQINRLLKVNNDLNNLFIK